MLILRHFGLAILATLPGGIARPSDPPHLGRVRRRPWAPQRLRAAATTGLHVLQNGIGWNGRIGQSMWTWRTPETSRPNDLDIGPCGLPSPSGFKRRDPIPRWAASSRTIAREIEPAIRA